MVLRLMTPGLKRLPVCFYRSDSGRGLEVEDHKVIGEDLKDVEFSWPMRYAARWFAWPRIVRSPGPLAARAALHG